MRGSRVGLIVAAMAIAVAARPVAGGDCAEKDRDERGRCPLKPVERKAGSGAESGAPRGGVAPRPAAKPTQLEIRGAEIAGVQVRLDGQVVGRAPLTVDTTPAPVRHLVEVKKDGHAPYAEWVEVKKGERRLVEVKLQKVAAGPVAKPAAPTAAPSPGACSAGMVRVPAGTFQMGGRASYEQEHTVTLSAYCIDRTEVTVEAYAACVAGEGCSPAPLTVKGSGYKEEEVKRWSRYCNGAARAKHPINCVDWNQAAAYCRWAGKRLPTEAEWEYAARHDTQSGQDRIYPWGSEAPSEKRLNACGAECYRIKQDLKLDQTRMYEADDGWATTAPVGSFAGGASPVGALDMAGNVWEWTADWADNYSSESVTNPSGPQTGSERVLRGGGWLNSDYSWVRTDFRSRYAPATRLNDVGFRCVRGN